MDGVAIFPLIWLAENTKMCIIYYQMHLERKKPMKTNVVKILLLAIVLAVALTGCNLIEIDPVKQMEEDIAKLDKAYAAPVATYGDQTLTASDVMAEFNMAYNQTYYMYYYYYGYQMTDDDAHQLMQDVLTEQVQEHIIADHFDADGMTLTEEELADCDTQAQSSFDEGYASFVAEADGKTDAAKDAQARTEMARMGYTKEALTEIAVLHAKGDKVQEKLRDEITEVTDEQLQAAYEEKVAADAENYTTGSSAFESAMTGTTTTVYSIPEGYRTVKHILVKPEDAVLTAYKDAVSAKQSAETKLDDLQAELASATDDDETTAARAEDVIRADIADAEAALAEQEAAVKAAEQACLDDVRATTDAIEERLAAGEDFIALMQEYGEDPGMQNEPTATRGYYVSAASTNWESNFTAAAMALQNVGDLSEPVVSGSGVHIIRYESDVTSGAVPLADVHDALYDATLESMKAAHYSDTIAAWVEAEAPTYDAEALEKAIAEGNK